MYRVLVLRAPAWDLIKRPYLSGLEYTLDFCVPLLDPFSRSKLPFLSDNFSVWKEQETKRGLKKLFSILVYNDKTQVIKGNASIIPQLSTVPANCLHF